MISPRETPRMLAIVAVSLSAVVVAAGEPLVDKDSSEVNCYRGRDIGETFQPSVCGWERRLNWIRSCTAAVVTWNPRADLLLLTIETGRASDRVVQCLLSDAEQSSFVLGRDNYGYFTPPFNNNCGGRGCRQAPEFLVINSNNVLIIPSAEFGIVQVTHVIRDLFLVDVNATSVGLAYLVRAETSESNWLISMSGGIDIEDAARLTFRVGHYMASRGIWIDVIVDGDGNLLRVVTDSQHCLDFDAFSQEHDWIDLRRVDQEEICYYPTR